MGLSGQGDFGNAFFLLTTDQDPYKNIFCQGRSARAVVAGRAASPAAARTACTGQARHCRFSEISGQCRFAGAALPCTCCVTAGAFCAACLRYLSVLPACAGHQRFRPAPVARPAAFAWCDRVLRQSADRHDRHDRHDRLDLCWQHDAKTESSSRRSQRGHPEAWQGRGAGQAARRPDFP